MPTHSITSRRHAVNAGRLDARLPPSPPFPPDHADDRLARAGALMVRSQARGNARFCLFLLATLAEDDLTVRISYRDLACLLGVVEVSCRRIVAQLVALGELQIACPAAGRRAKLYRLVA